VFITKDNLKYSLAMKNAVICLLISVLSVTVAMAQSSKSISILGDSYSTFEGYLQPDTNAIWYWDNVKAENTDVHHVRETWWHQFIKENGYRLCVNNSFSGATISYSGYKSGKPDFTDYSDRSFITRLKNLGTPDIILVFGGTNDSWAGSPIGEYQYEGWTLNDLFSFRPAMACLLEKMIDYYPNVEIVFLLNDDLKEEIDESVRTICTHYGVKWIEFEGIDKINGHPSVKGMKQISEQLKAFFNRENIR
jgi:hypothetical protein